VPKIVKIERGLTKLLQKENGAVYLDTHGTLHDSEKSCNASTVMSAVYTEVANCSSRRSLLIQVNCWADSGALHAPSLCLCVQAGRRRRRRRHRLRRLILSICRD